MFTPLLHMRYQVGKKKFLLLLWVLSLKIWFWSMLTMRIVRKGFKKFEEIDS
jgi:hypothetical protein